MRVNSMTDDRVLFLEILVGVVRLLELIRAYYLAFITKLGIEPSIEHQHPEVSETRDPSCYWSAGKKRKTSLLS